MGNACTFVITWVLARRRGWRVVLRIDDLDGPRIKPGAIDEAQEMLTWLGLDWDEGPRFETEWLAVYRSRLSELAQGGAIYPCRCTRAQIQRAVVSAPHAGEHELVYPGTCRPQPPGPRDWNSAEFAGAAWRAVVPAAPIRFRDEWLGWQTIDVASEVGDFLVATREGLPAYQLAVVIDDDLQGVTDVVRGSDLVASTGRQILLQRQLGIPQNKYWHTPLIVGPDGMRLAKRHGDTRLAFYRSRGVTAERVLGLIAFWLGMISAPEPMTLAAWISEFDTARVPRGPLCFGSQAHEWLLQ